MTLHQLANQRCKPLKGADHALSPVEVQRLLDLLPGWTLSDDGRSIAQQFRFADYHRTMAFVNAVAWIAHDQDHHPDLEVGYNRCLVRYSTHDVGGLSQNDFICAARVALLLQH